MAIPSRHYSKKPLSHDDILSLLKSRGLCVLDEDKAKLALQRIGYYRLSAYALPFEVPCENNTFSHEFLAGSTFESIYNLYCFDCELRTLVLSAIEIVEIALRSSFANELAFLTNDSHAYLLPHFFDASKYQENMTALSLEIERSRDTHIEHYRNTYITPAMPPIWSVTEVMSMGSLSKWIYSLSVTPEISIKPRIAMFLGFQRYDFLDSFLILITITRNICAHHARLFNRLFPPRIKIKSAPQSLQSVLWASLRGSSSSNKTPLYNILVLLAYVIEHIDNQCTWKQQLKSAISENLENNFSPQQLNGILQSLGFPSNWKDTPFWKN